MRLLAAAAGLAVAAAAPPTWRELETNGYSYSYSQFKLDFPEAKGSEEGFLASLQRIKAQNAKPSSWKAGINKVRKCMCVEW